jgi:hypothetical protein
MKKIVNEVVIEEKVSIDRLRYSSSKIYVLHSKHRDKIGIYSRILNKHTFNCLTQNDDGWIEHNAFDTTDVGFKNFLKCFVKSDDNDVFEFSTPEEFANWILNRKTTE